MGWEIINGPFKIYIKKQGRSRGFYKCKCTLCGVIKNVNKNDVEKKRSKSCGCSKRIHGMDGTKTYRAWISMKERCLKEGHPAFENYGGRGIKLDKRWMNFINFLYDMGIAPDGSSLDRIDNNLGYFKENCRWTDSMSQANNRRSNRHIFIDGKKYTVSEASREFDICKSKILYRLNSGYSYEECISKLSFRGRSK